MNRIFRLITLIVFLALLQACHSSPASENKSYQQKIDNWHQKRLDHLTQKDSWLSLAGLYWLQEGKNSFGSDSTNDLVFPAKAPAEMGSFSLKDSAVNLNINPDIKVMHDSSAVYALALKPDVSGDPTVLHHGSLSWYLIKRGDRWGIRLKDRKSAALKNFKGIERYPVDKKWRLEATFAAFDSTRSLNIPTILGQPAKVKIPGTLSFDVEGSSFSILPIREEGSPDQWFVVFGDQTNGQVTYGGGRFIYVDKVQDGGKTNIDFNKAYNPPCAFTAFATCPLPPSENRLDIAIEAGEKKYGDDPHGSHQATLDH